MMKESMIMKETSMEMEEKVPDMVPKLIGGKEGPPHAPLVKFDLAPFDPNKKKKKKKKDAADDSLAELTEKIENLEISDGIENAVISLEKKKKPVEFDTLNDKSEEGQGCDNDYDYEELLSRVFNALRECNPELAGGRRKLVMRPPEVLREGTKKTVLVNFIEYCTMMHRQPDHLMSFLETEMGTTASLDGHQRFVVKGRFPPRSFATILRQYMNDYVICNGCKSHATILSRENRLLFLRCEQCGSERSVAPIKAGFLARVGNRKSGT